MGDGLRLSRPSRRPSRPRDPADPLAQGDERLRVQHAHGRSSQDVRVREALGYLFDFDWVNRNLYFGAPDAARTATSPGSDLSSTGRPPDEQERELLAPSSGRRSGTTSSRAAGRRPPPTVRAGTATPPARRLALLARGRLGARRRHLRRTRHRRALRVRDAGQFPRRRSGLRSTSPQSLSRIGVRGAGAPRRRRPVLAAPAALRLRHGPVALVRLAVAGQRAAQPLGIGRGAGVDR